MNAPEKRPSSSCTCIAGDGAAECPYVDECLEEWRFDQAEGERREIESRWP